MPTHKKEEKTEKQTEKHETAAQHTTASKKSHHK